MQVKQRLALHIIGWFKWLDIAQQKCQSEHYVNKLRLYHAIRRAPIVSGMARVPWSRQAAAAAAAAAARGG